MRRLGWDRRRFLGTTALAGLGAAAWVAAGGRASAFRVDEENVGRTALYLSGCETQAAHDELAKDILAKLDGHEPPERARAIIQAMKCPICGCPLVAPLRE
jgi:hypothetical protein